MLHRNVILRNTDVIFNCSTEKMFIEKPSGELIKLLILLGKWSIHKYWLGDRKVPINVLFRYECITRYNVEKTLRKRSQLVEVFEKIIDYC